MTTPFGAQYSNLLTSLLSPWAIEDYNARTQTKIRTLRGGTQFNLDLSEGLLPVPWTRKVFPKTAAAEVAWFLQGTQNAEWLHKYTKIWSKFYDDPERRGEKILARSYGYRWRKAFGRDQILCALKGLSYDPSSRRIYVTAWDAENDGLNALPEDQKNVPCPLGFTLSIIRNELHSSLFIRSSDVFVGLPYDVMGHAILMSLFATSLGVDLGVMSVSLAHPHLYESHFLSAAITIKEHEVVPFFEMPEWNIREVMATPELFVQQYEQISDKTTWPEYNPKPEIIV